MDPILAPTPLHRLPNRKLAFHETVGSCPRQFFLYRPATEVAGAPLVVSVHGIARNAAAHAFRLMDEADHYGLCVVAPLFEKTQFGQYQQLEDVRTGLRSDLALLDILDAAKRLTDADHRKILLFGYSGGAQFAHRFAMAHPSRVASTVLVGAGWYTFPNEEDPYPYGLDTRRGGFALRLDAGAFARVPQHVIVGDLDVRRDSSLRRSKRLDRTQGLTRVERAQRWVRAMQAFAPKEQASVNPTYDTLDRVGHSFVDSVEMARLPKHVFARFQTDAGLSPISIKGK